jgi:hypothetical protein
MKSSWRWRGNREARVRPRGESGEMGMQDIEGEVLIFLEVHLLRESRIDPTRKGRVGDRMDGSAA